jgi:hypothetical protein
LVFLIRDSTTMYCRFEQVITVEPERTISFQRNVRDASNAGYLFFIIYRTSFEEVLASSGVPAGGT